MQDYALQVQKIAPEFLDSVIQNRVLHVPVGGRLRLFRSRWNHLTQDSKILDMLRGIKIPFKSDPLPRRGPLELNMPEAHKHYIDSEIQLLLLKRVIVEVPPSHNQYLSCIFLCEKKDGGFRLILDLSVFNLSVNAPHFKLESLQKALSLITPGSWSTKVDATDAFYALPLDLSFSRFLTFSWRGRRYSFRALLFGLAPSPFFYTKLFRPLLTYLRSNGVCITQYIDDGLINSITKTLCKKHTVFSVKSLLHFGFIVNFKKSVLVPTQVIEFLGFIINTVRMSVSLSSSKIEHVVSMCETALTKRRITVRFLAKLIGTFLALKPAVPLCEAHYRDLERLKLKHLIISGHRWSAKLTLTTKARTQIKWFADTVRHTSAPIYVAPPTVKIQVDASAHAWGAAFKSWITGGMFTDLDLSQSINSKETKAMEMGIKCFSSYLAGKHVLIESDSTTAVSTVRRLGSLHSSYRDAVMHEILRFSHENDITISATWISGVSNFRADTGSRTWVQQHLEWATPWDIFKRILEIHPTISYDLMAAENNAKTVFYCSRFPDPQCDHVDFLTLDCAALQQQHTFFCHPPLQFVHSLFRQLHAQNFTVVALLPFWPSAQWYPQIGPMSLSPPLLLPPFALQLPWDLERRHPLQNPRVSNLRFLLTHLSTVSSAP